MNSNIKTLLASPDSRTLLWLFILLVFLLLLCVVCFGLAYCHLDKKTREKIESNDFNIRVYTYDYVRKRYYSFDKINLTNVKNYTEEEFFAQFRRSDTYRIKEWFQAILNEKNLGSHSLQVDIKINKGKKYSASILNFTSINRDNHIIHFESQLLPYVTTTRANFDINKKASTKYFLKNEEECKRFLSGCDADILGSILYFEFFFTKANPTEEDFKTIEKAKNGAMNMVTRYLNKSRKLCKISSNDFLIIDTSSLSKLMTMNLASTIYTALQQYLNFNSPDIDLSIAIGVTIGTLYQGNYMLGKEQAKKMADAICQGKTKNDRVLLYDESFFLSYEQAKIQKEEVKQLLKNETFRLYFSATYDVESGLQSFYILRPKPYGISIEDFDDVISTAEDVKCGSRNGINVLFDSLYRKVQSATKSSTKDVKIALLLPYRALNKFVQFVQDKSPQIKWIVCVKTSDLLTTTDETNVILRNLKTGTTDNTEIALLVDTLSSNPRTNILRMAKYFFIPNTFTTITTNHEDAINDLRTIQATYYTPYKTPLVFYGLDHIDDIETGIVNGGRIFECKEVSQPSSRLESIEEESIDFLKSDAKKLAPRRILFDLPFKNTNKEK